MKALKNIVCLSMALVIIAASTSTFNLSTQAVPEQSTNITTRYSAMCPKCVRPTMQPTSNDRIWECAICSWTVRY